MQVWTNKDSAIVKCRYEEKDLVKAIGDFKFDKTAAVWIFPLKKLTDIIDSLKIDFSEETQVIYERLCKDKQAYHKKINLGNSMKQANCTVDKLPGVDLSVCYQHQKKAIALGALFDSYALFLETGTGKSLCTIKLFEYWNVPAMIISPLSALEGVWMPEIKKWSKKLKPVILWNNLKAFNSTKYNVYLINYEGFKKLVKTSKQPIDLRIQALAVDESSKLKHVKSGITKAVLAYKDKIKHKLCLTGTPAPNNMLEYFGQMKFINSDLLGDNFYKFRNTFFISYGFGGYNYKPMRGAREAILDRVSRQAISVIKTECLDLPDQVFEVRNIYLDEPQERAYEMMKQENMLEFEGVATLAVNQLAKIMKLRQITAGFTINVDGIPVVISRTKINALKELIEEIPEQEQIIIWCQFHWEIETIAKELGEDKCALFYGNMKAKVKAKSLPDFMANKKKFLIAHPLSGGKGLNLQHNSHYIIWFSMDYSSENFSQANDRIWRGGQKKKCVYFLLLAKNTIDEVIHKIVTKKVEVMEACMDFLKK